MDDDELRRGKPSSHKAFGECMALLAGDAMMIWAFGEALSGLARNGVPAERAARAAAYLSEAAGPSGMCGGQALDTDPASREPGDGFVCQVAEKKTAALIRASAATGAIIGGADDETLRRYEDYGRHLGMAFQIVDDILDETGTAGELGKTPGKDAREGKATFASVFGLERAARMAEDESRAAAGAIGPAPGGGLLAALAAQLALRRK
jgi:geranylgeranyl diphosphate synthase type II